MELLRRLSLWFVSGLGFSAGVAVVIWTYVHMDQSRRGDISSRFLPLDSVSIEDVEVIEITDRPAIALTLTNKASSDVSVHAEIRMLNGTKLLYACETTPSSVPAPGKSARVQLSCSTVQRSNVPAGTTYDVKVTQVFRLE